MEKKPTTKTGNVARKRRPPNRKKEPQPLQWKSIALKVGLTLMVLVGAYAVYLDAAVIKQFEGKKWAIPAKVYAHPLELFVGKKITLLDFLSQLQRQGYQPVEKASRPGTFARNFNRIEVYSRGFYFPDGKEPPRLAIIDFKNNQVVRLIGPDRRNLPLLRLDPQPIGGIFPAPKVSASTLFCSALPSVIRTIAASAYRWLLLEKRMITPALSNPSHKSFCAQPQAKNGSELPAKLAISVIILPRLLPW